MIDLIIWSKDRACQLDFLLHSLDINCQNIFNIKVLYTYSSKIYKSGYDLLIEKNKEVEFLKEENFNKNTYSLLSRCNNKWVSFCTDDTVFYRKSPYNKDTLLHFLPKNNNCIFSFRLGYNTLHQDIHIGSIQDPLTNEVELSSEVIMWNCKKYNPFFNYGYPFALDGHIFTKNLIVDILNTYKTWKNTNTLEGGLQKYIKRIDYISSYKKSIAVNLPVNNMSGYTSFGHKFKYSNEELNSFYLKGKCLSIDIFKEIDIIGCHQEVDLGIKT